MSAWNGSAYATDDVGATRDTIRINDYITQGVTDCAGTGVQNASTIAHEFGHALGLPDYYHWIDRAAGPQGRRWVLGCWSLMAAGSWGCGPVEGTPALFGPTHLTAHSKAQLGWVDYLDLGEVWNEEIMLGPVQTTGIALRVPLGSDGTEFLIAEYRAQTGFDASLPQGGVLFYKMDTSASRTPNPTGGEPYYMSLLEQDADAGLLRTYFEGGDRGEAGDAWGVGGVMERLHAETKPPLRLSDGGASLATVHEVSVVGGSARIVISTSQQPKLIAPAGPIEVAEVVSFLESIRIAGGRMPYTAMGSVPDGLALEAEGDELVVTGSLTDPGPVDLFLWIRDSAGATSTPLVATLSAPVAWTVALAQLLHPFLENGRAPLTAAQAMTIALTSFADKLVVT